MTTEGVSTEISSLTKHSRLLRKARSFRHELKVKIRRRSEGGSSSSTDTPPLSTQSSSSGGNNSKSSFYRPRPLPLDYPFFHDPSAISTSNNDATFNLSIKPHFLSSSTNSAEISETFRLISPENKKNLENDANKVYQVLSYTMGVVKKGTVDMLMGSITILLETVMQLTHRLDFIINKRSAHLLSKLNKLYKSLASLIKWSDKLLIERNDELSSETSDSTLLIKELQDSVQELVRIPIEQFEQQAVINLQKTLSIKSLTSNMEIKERKSLPDVFLTPEEKQSFHHLIDDVLELNVSKSSDNILEQTSEYPPPKPPLPKQFSIDKNPKATNFGVSKIENPPPLPPKQRYALTDTSKHIDNVYSIPFKTSFNKKHQSLSKQSSKNSLYNSSQQVSPSSSTDSLSGFDCNLEKSSENLKNKDICDLKSNHNSSLVSLYDNVTVSSNDSRVCDTKLTKAHEIFSEIDQIESNKQEMKEQEISKNNSSENLNLTTKNKFSTSLNRGNVTTKETPPIPPKQSRKNLQNYMKYMLIDSKNTVPLNYSLENRHSMQAISLDYQSKWHQHQMEHIAAPKKLYRSHTDISEKHRRLKNKLFGQISDTETENIKENKELQMHTNTDTIDHDLLDKSKDKPSGYKYNASDSSMPSQLAKINSFKQNIGDIDKDIGSKVPFISSHLAFNRESVVLDESSRSDCDSGFSETSLLERNEVTDHLVYKVIEEVCLSTRQSHASTLITNQQSSLHDTQMRIRGGPIDALIVHATRSGHNDFLYQEAFLTTYRTFIDPTDLISRLLYRHDYFSRSDDITSKKSSHKTFSLLVRVIDDLCIDFDYNVVHTLRELIVKLVSEGELMLARILRVKTLESWEHQRVTVNSSCCPPLLSSHSLTAHHYSLLDFSSEQLAEQMTLIDAALFSKISLAEVLLWSHRGSNDNMNNSTSQETDHCTPNLTAFTSHFNRVSYWCRTRLLADAPQNDEKQRQKILLKLCSVMKHLRKFNNFNSYLSVLSAVDCAPVRRLFRTKKIEKILLQFCDIIDSSASFSTYRQALAVAQAPCIPYLGLILQDLTFIHIGNQDFLPDGSINFSKRWQQFNILENMKKFRKCNYSFKNNNKIEAFFNLFDDYLCEDSLWQISEEIKPREKTKMTDKVNINRYV